LGRAAAFEACWREAILGAPGLQPSDEIAALGVGRDWLAMLFQGTSHFGKLRLVVDQHFVKFVEHC